MKCKEWHQGANGRAQGGGYGNLQASGDHRVCYAIPGRDKTDASDTVITSIILICDCFASVLFDLGSIFSYVSTHSFMDIICVCKPLDVSICFSTLVGETLVVDQVYQGCIVTLSGREA